MTREEKINLLNKLLEIEEKNDIGNLTRAERGEFQQWVETLEQEPTTKKDLGVEYISRSELMAILSDYYDTTVEYRSMLKEIAALPPVTPQEPKTGHWIKVHPLQENDEGDYMCSECKCGGLVWKSTTYCPNCGAKMVETEADNG